MLTVKKEMDLNDFMDEYATILPDDREACEIIFSSLEERMTDGAEDMTIRDYIRFQLYISTQSELLSNYDIIDEEEIKEMDEDEIHERIEEYLNYNTYLLGSYEDNDGVMVYIYDEF